MTFRARRTLTLALICMVVGSCGPAFAQSCPVPIVDGNLDDLIAYAACVDGCGMDELEPAGDVCMFNDHFVPCSPRTACGGGYYFANGFDLVRAMLAYDRSTQTLFLGLRVAGVIGDTDGDGDPNNSRGAGCAPADNIIDEPGIGSLESYQMLVDTNCDNAPDIQVQVSGSQASPEVSIVDGNGDAISGASGTAAYAGSDLEVRIEGLSLPRVLAFSGFVRCGSDGLSDDGFGPLQCSTLPFFGLELATSASTGSLCPGASVDITAEIHNTSTAGLADVTLTDLLPAGLSYVANTTGGTCAATEPTVDGQELKWNVGPLAEDQRCTITFSALRAGNDCSGTATNHAEAMGTYQQACVNGGVPVGVYPVDDLNLTCESCVAEVPCRDGSAGDPALPPCGSADASGLALAAPNPFSGSLSYSYRIPPGATPSVQIGVYDMTGRLVRTLVSDRQAPGAYSVRWNAGSDARGDAPPGVYFLRARIGRETHVSRVIRLQN